MSNYWWKYLLFSCGFLAISTGLYFISEKVEPVYPILTQRYQQLENQKDQIEVVTLGSSHSVAIDFSTLSVSGYHLWDFAEDLFESKFKTTHVLNRLPQLKTVFLNLPYPIFLHDNSHSDLGARYRNRAKLHYISQSFQFIDHDINALVKGKTAPISRYDHWVFLPKHVRQQASEIIPVKETLSIDTLTTDGNMRGFTKGFQAHQALEEIALEKLDEQLHFVQQSRQNVWNIESKTTAALVEIIQQLQARHVRVVLYTSPFYRTYLEHFSPEIHQDFKSRLAKICTTYKLSYYDFSNHPDFIDQANFFQDGNHLSTLGAVKFSELLRAEVFNR